MFAKDTKRSVQLSVTPSLVPNNLSSSTHESLVSPLDLISVILYWL